MSAWGLSAITTTIAVCSCLASLATQLSLSFITDLTDLDQINMMSYIARVNCTDFSEQLGQALLHLGILA